MQETGPNCSPYLRRPECLTINFADIITKAARSPQLLKKTLSVGSVRGSNPRPPTQQSGALTTDVTSGG